MLTWQVCVLSEMLGYLRRLALCEVLFILVGVCFVTGLVYRLSWQVFVISLICCVIWAGVLSDWCSVLVIFWKVYVCYWTEMMCESSWHLP